MLNTYVRRVSMGDAEEDQARVCAALSVTVDSFGWARSPATEKHRAEWRGQVLVLLKCALP